MEYLFILAIVLVIAVVAIFVTIGNRREKAEAVASWVPSEAAVISIDRQSMERLEGDDRFPHFRLNVRYEFQGKSYDKLLILNYWTTKANFPELVAIQAQFRTVGSVIDRAKESMALSKELKEKGASQEEVNRVISEHFVAKRTQHDTIIPILVHPENPGKIRVDPSKVDERSGGSGFSIQ